MGRQLSTSMLWGHPIPFLLAAAITASSMRLRDDLSIPTRSYLLNSSPWTPSAWPHRHQEGSASQKFPYSWMLSPSYERPGQSSTDLQAELLRHYFALQGLQLRQGLQVQQGLQDQQAVHDQQGLKGQQGLQNQQELQDLQQGNNFDRHPFSRGQRLRIQEYGKNEENTGEKGEEGKTSKNEDQVSRDPYNQQLSTSPELFPGSQAGPRRLLRRKKEEETQTFIKKTLLPYPRLG